MFRWSDCGYEHLEDTDERYELPAPDLFEQGETEAAALELLATELLGMETVRTVETPLGSVDIRREYLPHLVEKRHDARERYARFVMPTLTAPFEVWKRVEESGTVKFQYIGVYTGTHDFMVVVAIHTDGRVMWNMMHASRKKMNSHRKGECIYKK